MITLKIPRIPLDSSIKKVKHRLTLCRDDMLYPVRSACYLQWELTH